MSNAPDADSGLPQVGKLVLVDETGEPLESEANNAWKTSADDSSGMKNVASTAAPPSFDPSTVKGFAPTPTPQNSTSQSRLNTPDPSVLDSSVARGFESDTTAENTPSSSRDILNEFDPLDSHEEKSARAAWSETEGNPPPVPPEKSPPATPQKDAFHPVPSSATVPASPSSFPSSLTALARTFSLPKITRSRPTSFDAAKPVPSPATLSSFAEQQHRSSSPRPSQPPASDPHQDAPKPSGPVEEPAFDFQKFLDQMKTRSAEPVAKYLKSCVPCYLVASPALNFSSAS